MKIKATEPGYTLLLSLMVITLIVGLVIIMANKSSVHSRYIKTIIDREKAKSLALSGMQIAISQLAHMHEPPSITGGSQVEGVSSKSTSGESKGEGKDAKKEAQQFLANILPILNKWQTFKLKRQTDGIRGTIKICIGSEEGKIDINQIFDFVQKKFVGEGSKEKDYKKIAQEVFKAIQDATGMSNLFGPFEKFLKDRQNELYDPTELLELEEYKELRSAIFFEPEVIQRNDGKQLKQTVYLNDIFTLWSFQRELNPWLLSHSLKVLLGIEKDASSLDLKATGLNVAGKKEDRTKKLQEVTKEFLPELKWPESWQKIFKPLYGIDFDRLPKEMRRMLGTKFEPSIFSVLSYGSVGQVTQKLFVILEKVTTSKKEQSGSGKSSFEFRARKFYWL